SRASGASGAPANGSSFSAVISRDGRHVAFYSQATNLDPAGTAPNQVYVRDLDTNVTKLGSRAHGPDGAVANGDSYSASISEDGADTNNTPDVYVSDGGTITLASRADGTTGAGGNGYTSGASMNKDGTQVAFASSSSNLVTGDVNGKEDVFVRNLSTGHTVLVSRADGAAGAEGDNDSYLDSINTD